MKREKKVLSFTNSPVSPGAGFGREREEDKSRVQERIKK